MTFPVPGLPDLPTKQMRAATALAQGFTIEEAAERACCSEKTIDRWLQKPEFQEVKIALQRQIHDTEIQAYLEALKSNSDQYFRIAQSLLDKIENWANDIDFDSMSHNNILKTIAETRAITDAAMNGRDGALGLDKLREMYLKDLSDG